MTSCLLRRVTIAAAAALAVVFVAGCDAGRPAAIVSTEPPTTAETLPLTATRVVDGDTFEGSDGVTYRLAAIDAPESEDPLGSTATRRLEELLDGEIDVELGEVQPIDRHGRTLVYVFAGETFVNETLIREGLAAEKFYGDNVKYRERYLDAQAAARAAGLGIWAETTTTAAPPAPATTTTVPPPPPTTAPPPPPPTTAAPPAAQACTPSYDPCVPPASDVDCLGGSGNGPAYTGPVRVTGPDIYDLDRDGDGFGCESS
jgi:endonuclease YncB( thermonuclease family)